MEGQLLGVSVFGMLIYYLAASLGSSMDLFMHLVSVDLNSLGEFWAFVQELLIRGRMLLLVMGFWDCISVHGL